jgi:hypothetical protein
MRYWYIIYETNNKLYKIKIKDLNPIDNKLIIDTVVV